MRKIWFISALLSSLTLPVSAQASNRLTQCLWLAKGGSYCSQSFLRHNIFDLPGGDLTGCRAVAGQVDYHGRSGKHPQVALTFDDGPSAYTPGFLRVLKRYHVPAGFFLIGEQVESGKALVNQELQDGHILGSHSWNHPMLSRAPDLASQFRDSQAVIFRSTGFRPCFMRPPYGDWNSRVQAQAKSNHLAIINWDVDTRDWSRPGTQAIVRNALSGVRNGSIILMHDGGGDRSQTLAALPQIITGLRKRGFRLVRLDKILHIKLQRSGLSEVR